MAVRGEGGGGQSDLTYSDMLGWCVALPLYGTE